MTRRATLVAPAGPVHEETFHAGVAVMGELGIAVRWDGDGLLATTSYLAGSDARRAAELVRAASEGGADDAVWMARGGYGSIRALAALDQAAPGFFEARRRSPLFGFSDGTLLCGAWDRAGWPCWSAPPVTQLPRLDEASRARLRAVWHADHVATYRDLAGLVPGRARAPLAGGNLCVLASAAGTPWEVPLADRIVFVEDVGEPAYKVDRFITQLRLAGAFDGIRGLVFGQFTNTAAKQVRWMDEFFAAAAPEFGVPVARGLPIGHGTENAPLPLGPATGFDAILDVAEDGTASLSFCGIA